MKRCEMQGQHPAGRIKWTTSLDRDTQPTLPAPKITNIEKGTDVDRVANLEDNLDDLPSVNGPTERAPERDERGRL
jgi:hypothetical protein